MNIIDIIIIIPSLWFAYKGFSKGFLIEAASLGSLIIGIWVAIHFSWWISNLIGGIINIESKYLPLTGFAITFIGIVIIIHIIAKTFTKALSKIALGTINKIAGACFGVIKVLLIFGIIIIIINRYDPKGNIINDEIKKESLVYVPLDTFVTGFYPSIEKKFGSWSLSDISINNTI